MEPGAIEYVVRELKKDIDEIKKDVKTLMIFMAVKKSEDQKRTIWVSGGISLFVAVVAALMKYVVH